MGFSIFKNDTSIIQYTWEQTTEGWIFIIFVFWANIRYRKSQSRTISKFKNIACIEESNMSLIVIIPLSLACLHITFFIRKKIMEKDIKSMIILLKGIILPSNSIHYFHFAIKIKEGNFENVFIFSVECTIIIFLIKDIFFELQDSV